MLVNQAELAGHAGLSESYISQLKTKKVITAEVSNKFDLEKSLKDLGRYVQKKPKLKAAIDAPGEAAGEAPADVLNLTMWRGRRTKADALKAEMEADEMAKELLQKESVVETWQRSFLTIKSKMMSLPSRLGPQLALIEDPKIVTAQLKSAICRILNDLERESRIPG